MIEARVDDRGLTARLTAKAGRIAKAASANRLKRRSSDPSRWRNPALLWPLFTQG